MDAQELKILSDAFHRQIVASVEKRCPIVAAPGPDENAVQFWAEGLIMVLAQAHGLNT